MQISIKMEGLESLKRALTMTEKEIDKATVMGINKTATKAKTEMKRAISSEYMVTQREIAPRLSIRKAKRGSIQAWLEPFASPSKPGARSMNLIHFLEKKVTLAEGRRRKKSGTQNQLRFKIKRVGGLKTIKGAFVGNKGRTIFKRSGKGRLPIEGVQTIGVRAMFSTKKINNRVIAKIRKDGPIEVSRAMDQVIRRRFK